MAASVKQWLVRCNKLGVQGSCSPTTKFDDASTTSAGVLHYRVCGTGHGQACQARTQQRQAGGMQQNVLGAKRIELAALTCAYGSLCC